jgi:hypothetical protein
MADTKKNTHHLTRSQSLMTRKSLKGTTLFDCTASVSIKGKTALFLFALDLSFLPDMEKLYARVSTSRKTIYHHHLKKTSILLFKLYM